MDSSSGSPRPIDSRKSLVPGHDCDSQSNAMASPNPIACRLPSLSSKLVALCASLPVLMSGCASHSIGHDTAPTYSIAPGASYQAMPDIDVSGVRAPHRTVVKKKYTGEPIPENLESTEVTTIEPDLGAVPR